MVTDALERKLYVIRKTREPPIQALKLKHGKEYFVPSMSARTVVYKGLLLADQVGVYYRDLQDARVRLGARARAPALLDQHVPRVAARPPVPDDRPQRRDQHGQGQRQLDERAREGAIASRRCSATTCRSCSR